MAHIKCTCEYCCFVQDLKDDKDMEQEYDLNKIMGKDVFDSLNVCDSVMFYSIPYENRNSVYAPEFIKWEYIEEKATRKYEGTITTKNEHTIEITTTDNSKRKMTAAECWACGLHKQ